MLNLLTVNITGDRDIIPKDGTCLIDGDVVLYACGFIADKEGYYNKEQAFKLIDDMIFNIVNKIGLKDYRIFLSDDVHNFRKKVAKSHSYKGNRKKKFKPFYFKAMKKYMIQELGAVTVHGAEADDALGLAQTKNTVICTIDKDLDMIEGCHFNWKSNTVYNVEKADAQLFFWIQMLTGDSVDNIKGIKGIGTVKAGKLLKECKDPQSLRKIVRKAYTKEFGKKALKRFKENYGLLKISGADVNL